MLYSIPEPVDPVGNAPSTQLLNPDILVMQPTQNHERLHNLAGPAMVFSDGWWLYSMHDSFVSERLVTHPDQVGLEDLPLDENLEVLHTTIKLLGQKRFLAASGARLYRRMFSAGSIEFGSTTTSRFYWSK